jgi:hypothetical protein
LFSRGSTYLYAIRHASPADTFGEARSSEIGQEMMVDGTLVAFKVANDLSIIRRILAQF